MSTPLIFDLEPLLAPITDGEYGSVGKDFREDHSQTSNYSQLKSARKAARDAERNNIFDSEQSQAANNWHKILTLAPALISNETKDLEVACWYTEALLRQKGFKGLRVGFTLLRRLIEDFWDDGLYPQADEDGLETRVSPISGLNGEGADGVLLSPIRSTYITDDVDPGPYSLWQYKQAIDTKRIQDDDRRRNQEEKVGFTFEDIEKSINSSESQFFIELFDDVAACLDEYNKIGALLTEHCGIEHAPSTSKIIELLDETVAALNHIAKDKLPVQQEVVVEELQQDDASESQTTAAKKSVDVGAALATREDAFTQLRLIADYFRKTEPHSPVSYIITRAINWGDMPLEQLMNELIPESGSRDTYSSLTGVKIEE